jgi:hypothetical protein
MNSNSQNTEGPESERNVNLIFAFILFILILGAVTLIYIKPQPYFKTPAPLYTKTSITQTPELTPFQTQGATFLFHPNPETLIPTMTMTFAIKSSQAKTSLVEIALIHIKSINYGDGRVINTAQLSIDPLGLGSMRVTSPSVIKLGESSVIRLLISPDSILSHLPKVAAPILSANAPNYAIEFNDRLQIYPIMTAELQGLNFDIVSTGNPSKPVTSNLPVEWVWNVAPKSSGRQTLTLVISVPVILDNTQGIASALALKDIPIEIQVEVTTTPLPSNTPQPSSTLTPSKTPSLTLTPSPTSTSTPTLTPTSIPVITRIGDQIINNVAVIIGAIITLIGVLVTAYWSNKKPKENSSQTNGKPKENESSENEKTKEKTSPIKEKLKEIGSSEKKKSSKKP